MHNAYVKQWRRRERLTPRGREVGAGGVEKGRVRRAQDAARRHRLHARHHLGPMRRGVRRVGLGQLPVGHPDVAGPAGVARVAGGEVAGDRQALLVGGERAGEVALGDRTSPTLFEADRDVAGPAGVARVAGGEVAGDRQALVVGASAPGRSPWAKRTSPTRPG